MASPPVPDSLRAVARILEAHPLCQPPPGDRGGSSSGGEGAAPVLPEEVLVNLLRALDPGFDEDDVGLMISDSGARSEGSMVRIDAFVRYLGAGRPQDGGVNRFVFDARGAPGCRIERTEERAITLQQLGVLLQNLRSFCTARSACGGAGDRLAEAARVNLYDVVQHVVLPSTQARSCSFVELLATGPQPPTWFVSHWWGEPVVAFTRCLRQHSQDRRCPDDAGYWVCAYANNQWDLDKEIGDTPDDSSFRRAMRLAVGTVSVMDAEAACYTRIWCIFEVFISLGGVSGQRPDYLFDIYTVGTKTVATGITDGYVPGDFTKGAKKCARHKRHREAKFPWEMIRGALAIRVQTAQASNDLDRRRILGRIAGLSELSEEPPLDHPRYSELNSVLHGRFASAAWVPVVACEGRAPEDLRAALLGSRLAKLALHFGGGCEQSLDGDLALADLSPNLPPTLERLSLLFNGFQRLTDVGLETLSARLPELAQLNDLELGFECCRGLSDTGFSCLVNAIASLPALKSLNLRFLGCNFITDASVAAAVQRLTASSELVTWSLDLARRSSREVASVPDS